MLSRSLPSFPERAGKVRSLLGNAPYNDGVETRHVASLLEVEKFIER